MMSEPLFYAAAVWFGLLAAAVVIHFMRAPTTGQRILAVDLLTVVLIGFLALVSARSGKSYALDAALVLALLGFVSTLAACRYYESRRPFS